jgi:peptidyl-dipeptidase Dcp
VLIGVQVRQSRYNFDEAELKPYLSLEAMTAAVFDVAGQLFGLRFVERPDIAGYHPDVKVAPPPPFPLIKYMQINQ